MIDDLFQQIRSELVTLEEEVKSKQELIQALVDKKNLALEKAEEATRERDKTINSAYKEVLLHKETISRFSEEAKSAREEIGILTEKKSALMIVNDKLEQQNRKLKDYEKKAWIVLNAKDEELTSREQVIAEKEQLKPQSHTLLPSIE